MTNGLPPRELAKVRIWLGSLGIKFDENQPRDEGGKWTSGGGGGGAGAGSVPSAGGAVGPRVTSDKYTSPRGIGAAVKAIKSIPMSHRDALKNVSVKVYESTIDFKPPAGETGMYSPKDKKIEVAETFKLGSRDVPVANLEQTIVRELGRAYNDATQAASKLDTQQAVGNMSWLEKMRARHFIKNSAETFAELYTLAYSPGPSNRFFGLDRKRAEELYAKPLAQLRATKSIGHFARRANDDNNRLVRNGVAVNDDGAVYVIVNGSAYEVDASDTPLAQLAAGDYPQERIEEMLKALSWRASGTR